MIMIGRVLLTCQREILGKTHLRTPCFELLEVGYNIIIMLDVIIQIMITWKSYFNPDSNFIYTTKSAGAILFPSLS